MAVSRERLRRLEKQYGGALNGEIDLYSMSYNELLDYMLTFSDMLGFDLERYENEISKWRKLGFGDEKPDRLEALNSRKNARSFTHVSNNELKVEINRLAKELGLTLPDFEIV